MADTRRSVADLISRLPDNTSGQISPQDIRDLLASVAPPYGSCYLSTTSQTSIAAVDTWTKVAGTTTSRHLKEFTHSSNRLTYTGVADVHIHCVASISMISAVNNQTFALRIAKNGDANNADSVASQIRRKVANLGDVGSTAIHFDTVMSTNDYIEVFVLNETSGGDMTMTDMYFFVLGMIV